MQRLGISILLLSIVAPFLWSLDANPLLLIYDAYATKRSSSSIALSISSNDEINNINRRIFPPGSTSMEGKTIWITGASSGIGAETAVQLAFAGAGHLILSGRRREKLESVAESCRDASEMRSNTYSEVGETTVRVSIVPFDMSAGPGVLDSAVSMALQAATPSGIDVLVLNAGQYHIYPALETDLGEALPYLMQINFASPVQLCQKLIQRDQWKERKYGHVVAISSLMGRGMAPLNALYSASKHALRGYFYGLSAEESSWLRVDIVLPGATDTGLWEGSSMRGIERNGNSNDINSQSNKRVYADDRSKMPVHRCAQLIVSSMIGPHSLFFETWITRNPGLLWVYLASYEPTTFHYFITYVIAPLRIGMWRKFGEDALYLPTLIGYMWECVLDYYSGKSDSLFP